MTETTPTPAQARRDALRARWDALLAAPEEHRHRHLLALLQRDPGGTCPAAWVITKDFLASSTPFTAEAMGLTGQAGPRSREGKAWVSPFGFTWVLQTRWNAHALVQALPLQWRVLDDDGEVYYMGRCTGDIAAEQALEWAMNDAGAVRVDTRKGHGPWETLIA